MTLFKLLFLALARWQVRIMFSFLVRKIKERLECPKKSCVADLTWNDHVAKNPWAKSRRSEPEQKRTAFKYWVPISDDDSAWNKASVRWSKGNKKKKQRKNQFCRRNSLMMAAAFTSGARAMFSHVVARIGTNLAIAWWMWRWLWFQRWNDVISNHFHPRFVWVFFPFHYCPRLTEVYASASSFMQLRVHCLGPSRF